LVVRGIPALRHQTGRARDRPRIPGAIRQVGGKDLALIGRDQHIVLRRGLREDRYLALDLRDAAVGAARAAGVLEMCAPARFWRRSASRRASASANSLSFSCEPRRAASAATSSTPDIAPSASASIERVGAVWMTLARQSSLAQPVVESARIEEENVSIGVGRFEQVVTRKIGDHKGNSAIAE
jgi:hypothetical protein